MVGGRQRLPSLPPSQIWPESGGGRLVAGQRPGGRRRRRLPAVMANSLPTCLSPRP
uniref:Uncharacterized protein n=1 Tax=Oryza nivara TaxID=4536 RepID=A0A0E0GXZ5_ORYNI